MPLLAARSLYEAAVVVIPIEPPGVGGGSGVLLRQPEDIRLYLEGVAANPRVGRGTLTELSKLYPYPKPQPAPKPVHRVAPQRRRAPAKVEEPPPVPVPIVVRLSGVQSVPVIGTGTVKTVFELLEEEIIALLEAA